MEEPKKNKALTPSPSPEGRGEKVKIKMRQGRAVTGVTVDANGYATVDAKLAEELVKNHYAVYAE